jgi:hypothetical protein
MPSSSKPRHKRKVKTTGNRLLRTQPWKTQQVFRPLEAILDELETQGTLNVVDSGPQAGKPAFQIDGEVHWYVAAPAIRGLIETMEVHESRSGHKLPLDPLRELAGKLERDEEIDSHDTRAVRAAMHALIQVSHSFDRNYAADLVTVTRTNIELERIGREA